MQVVVERRNHLCPPHLSNKDVATDIPNESPLPRLMVRAGHGKCANVIATLVARTDPNVLIDEAIADHELPARAAERTGLQHIKALERGAVAHVLKPAARHFPAPTSALLKISAHILERAEAYDSTTAFDHNEFRSWRIPVPIYRK
jgi:hypothetical protein